MNNLVEFQNVCLKFGEIEALKNVSFTLYPGKVCTIMGENGSGKSSMMKVLSGVYTKTSGEVLVDGEPVKLGSVYDAHRLGIRMIFHEVQLLDNFTVLDNIFLGHEVEYPNSPFINQRLQENMTQSVLEFLECNIDPKTPVSSLNLLQKRLVEIAKAVVFGVRLLILDEITVSFTSNDKDAIFRVLNRLKGLGVSIVFISHRMEHIVEISDRIIVMRGGEIVEERDVTEDKIDVGDVLIKMAGKDYFNRYPKTKNRLGKVVLEAKNLKSQSGYVRRANFVVHKGEIVGIAGLQGMGKTTLARLLSGVEAPTDGEILLDGYPIGGESTSQFVRRGIAYLSEDNNANLMMDMDVKYNITLSDIFSTLRGYFVNRKQDIDVAEYFIKHMHLKDISHNSMVGTLSRGNQQKVALSKWIQSRARVLVFNQPSANLDSASKIELYNLMNKMSSSGTSIVMASSDLSELMGMCERIYVMYEGMIVKEIREKEKSSLLILEYASGKLRDESSTC